MDMMKEFEDNHFELAIVDPPYGIGLKNITETGAAGKNFPQANGKRYPSIHKHKPWNDSTPSPEYFNELHRVSRNQIIWGCRGQSLKPIVVKKPCVVLMGR